MSFGDRLKEARVKNGFTQQELAQQIGVAKSTLTGYEKGNREPDVLKIKMLTKILKVTGDYLLETEKLMENFPVSICETGNEAKEEIVKIYDGLNGEGQNLMLEHAHYLGSQGKYKKRDTDGRLP